MHQRTGQPRVQRRQVGQQLEGGVRDRSGAVVATEGLPLEGDQDLAEPLPGRRDVADAHVPAERAVVLGARDLLASVNGRQPSSSFHRIGTATNVHSTYRMPSLLMSYARCIALMRRTAVRPVAL